VKPLVRLFEHSGLTSFGISPELATAYGGDFGLQRPGAYANLVESVDGIVALPGTGESGSAISSGDLPDRFIMGLLRASADAILIGAETFRRAGCTDWLPETASPIHEGPFEALRKQLHLPAHPSLIVVTASGRIEATRPSLENALVITTHSGRARLADQLPAGARTAVLEGDRFSAQALLAVAHAHGFRVVVTEGGPSLLALLLGQGVIDELFLTVAPALYGRQAEDGRKALIEGVDLSGQRLVLSSASRHDSYLYLRYRMGAGAGSAGVNESSPGGGP